MRLSFSLAATVLLAFIVACGDGPDASSPGRSQLADKWLSRAKLSFKAGDLEDATQAIDGALKAAPKDRETRLTAARIALSKLEFNEVVKQTEGLEGADLCELSVLDLTDCARLRSLDGINGAGIRDKSALQIRRKT